MYESMCGSVVMSHFTAFLLFLVIPMFISCMRGAFRCLHSCFVAMDLTEGFLKKIFFCKILFSFKIMQILQIAKYMLKKFEQQKIPFQKLRIEKFSNLKVANR